MIKSISDIIGRDIVCAIYNDQYLIKRTVEKLYPEYDFSIYNTIVEENMELIDEWALLNELMKNDQYFRGKILCMLDSYKNYGYFGDSEFEEMIFQLASGYENNIEELFDIGDLEINNCFQYAPEIMHRSTDGNRISKKQQKRRKAFMKETKEEKTYRELSELMEVVDDCRIVK